MIKAVANFRAGRCNRIAVLAAVAALNVRMGGLCEYSTDQERDCIIELFNEELAALGGLREFITLADTGGESCNT